MPWTSRWSRDGRSRRTTTICVFPPIIISKSVKARYWPGTSALGKRIDIGNVSARVVGVVGDVHIRGLDVPADQFLYLPMLDAAGGGVQAMTMTVRTAVEPLSLVSAIRSAIAEVDGDLPMAKVQSMERVLGDSMSRTSFTMSVLVIAALVALFLGAVGIYGVLSYVVSLRTPEIGIRLALGASPGAVRRMVLSQGMRLAGAGALIGTRRRHRARSCDGGPSVRRQSGRSGHARCDLGDLSRPSPSSPACCPRPARPARRRWMRCAAADGGAVTSQRSRMTLLNRHLCNRGLRSGRQSL